MGRKKGVILSYILMVFEVLSTLLLTPLIIRSLGPSEYGVYKLSASIVAYLALLDLGIGNSVIRFSAKFKANNDSQGMSRFLGVAQCFYGGLSVISLVVGLGLIAVFPMIFASGLTAGEISLAQTLLSITTVNTAVTLLTTPYLNIIVGHGLFGVSKGASIVQIIVRMTVTYAALAMGLKSIAIVSINLALTVVLRFSFVLFVFFRLKIRPVLQGVTKVFVLEIFGYSFWIFLQMVATQVNAYADQVLIGILVPGASIIIGVYSMGAQIIQYFQSIGSAVSGVLMPGVVSMVESGADSNKLEAEMIRIGRFSLIVLSTIFGGFLAFGQQFVVLWAGAEYTNGFYVAAILMFAWMMIYPQSIGSQILWAKNQHKEQSLLKICIVLVNVILTVFLIKWDPLIGATIGTFLSLIVGDIVVMNLIFRKKIGISLKKYYASLVRGILPANAVAVAAAFSFRMLRLQGWAGFAVNILFYCCVSAAMLLAFGFSHSEKQLLLNLKKSILRFGKTANSG